MLLILGLWGLGGSLQVARAQDEATIASVAALLQAEDARRYDPALLGSSVRSVDAVVRKSAALAIGRIGDRAGTVLLIPLLLDPDSSVQLSAGFGLGLLRDSTAVSAILRRFHDSDSVSTVVALELITALAKIGGRPAGTFLGGLLGGAELSTRSDRPQLSQRALIEAWRLGGDAPVDFMLPFAEHPDEELRYPALYALGRLRVVRVADQMIRSLRDREPLIRAVAAKTLSRSYADSARLDGGTISDLLARTAQDIEPGVRIQALRSLATFPAAAMAGRIVPLLDDQSPNVAVQAAATLGRLGGSAATQALVKAGTGRGSWALRREAQLGLAASDSAAFVASESAWRLSPEWRDRAVAAEGWARLAGGRGPGRPEFLEDVDGRVVAASLQTWSELTEGPNPALVAAARRLLSHQDAVVRSVAADIVGRAADPADLAALTAAYRRSVRDSISDPALSALGALAAISRGSPGAATRVEREFLAHTPVPADYLQRRWAEREWPAAAKAWGPAAPIATGRTLEDYRDLARRFVTNPGDESRPHVFIETEPRGTIELELFGQAAPLTVANFLRLVDRHFFERNRWHRVVPDFVVQDGDPRGDGWGGPGGAIRDELNLYRYGTGIVGMALSGPDTGSSQWFITLSPQPHLDGVYTVFGKVVAGYTHLLRITQGDLIRSIHR